MTYSSQLIPARPSDACVGYSACSQQQASLSPADPIWIVRSHLVFCKLSHNMNAILKVVHELCLLSRPHEVVLRQNCFRNHAYQNRSVSMPVWNYFQLGHTRSASVFTKAFHWGCDSRWSADSEKTGTISLESLYNETSKKVFFGPFTLFMEVVRRSNGCPTNAFPGNSSLADALGSNRTRCKRPG